MTREQQIGWKSWEIADYKFWRAFNIIWKNIIRLIGANNGEKWVFEGWTYFRLDHLNPFSLFSIGRAFNSQVCILFACT